MFSTSNHHFNNRFGEGAGGGVNKEVGAGPIFL
jgi:hypothetical protein